MLFHFKKDFEFCYWQALFVVGLILITSTSLLYTSDLCLKINERSRSDVKSDSLWFITTRCGTIVMAHYHNTNFVRSWSPIANTCVFFLNFKISNSVRIKKSIKGLCPASLWNENRIFQVRNFRNRRNELVRCGVRNNKRPKWIRFPGLHHTAVMLW